LNTQPLQPPFLSIKEKAMKKGLLFFLVIGIFISCQKEDEPSGNDLIGSWELIEMLADPGDGSGTFQPVESDKIVTFKSDGTISSNGDLCSLSAESGAPSSGIYSLIDSTIISPDCSSNPFNISFQLSDDWLILRYPCIEPCALKFQKL
jgi:hypothetical protein